MHTLGQPSSFVANTLRLLSMSAVAPCGVSGKRQMPQQPTSSGDAASNKRWSCSTQTVLLAGAALRLALLIVGEWQDAHLELKYTDIDYAVITDAAAAVAAGGSPFERRTFRYTPLLAWAALPNVWLHRVCGKVLFAAADILAGWWVLPCSLSASFTRA